jgi:hypothetical protein
VKFKETEMGERNSFVLLYKYNDILKDLNDKQAGVLIKAIFKYQIEGKLAHFSDLELRMAFKFIQKDMDFNNYQYQEKCLKNSDNGKKGGRPPQNRTVIEKTVRFPENTDEKCEKLFEKIAEKTERLFEKPKKPDNDVDNDKDKRQKIVCMSKLVDLRLPDGASANVCHAPTHSFPAPLGKVGFSKGNGFPPPSPKPSYKSSSSAAKLYEAFRVLYGAQTHFPYHARKEDLASMEILVKRHGEHAVENKIRILHSACKNAAFWFTKKGFSDFNIAYLFRFWNELVPFETDEQKQERLSLEKTREVAKKIFEERQKERQKWQSNRSKAPTKS